ncbi:MAG: 2-oxoacid:ferredoxin oxidoreductase subunit beta [Ignavibacteria bacterium CG08_land_8_20_14_0_20_37_9]|nr:MAG: 2-oxoacid:ferredoxin oxidoreductase subunit beta [Ignavibacteria bacterium CG08_land_8_20_14_0_20_37_9]PJC60495.1 MAG: 2-oxoacid:ferredoxin oxidoreductase subunit beta [Ignavibacteria bacterium CG_4_9_14_0_2_um_filter_37_13]
MSTKEVMEKTENVKLTAKDFATNQDVRWCPGCGDYSILAQAQRISPELGIPREKFVWVSGIGCSSRFPYYMDTYGFHSIHGRAPAIATGVKLANPDLSVWVAAGDGDLLSIGGNHFIHACRRNIDLKVILFNNRIYGLTKGQYSPTSEKGKKTKSSPYGSIDFPFLPVNMAVASGATFVARSIDRDPKHLQAMMLRAAAHHGLAFIEIYQNCNIFNDGAYEPLTNKETKPDHVVVLEHGKPLIFGKNNDKGIRLDGMNPIIVDLTKGEYSVSDLWVHDEFDSNPGRSFVLAHFSDLKDFPAPIGVFRQIQKSTYDGDLFAQLDEVTKMKGKGDLAKLFRSGNTWEVA